MKNLLLIFFVVLLGISAQHTNVWRDSSVFMKALTVPQSANTNLWRTTGNAGTSSSTNFIGTTDGADLRIHQSDSNEILLKLKSGDYQQDFSANIFSFWNPSKTINGMYYHSEESELSVVGTFIYADGNEGVGKILTSDANGLASWQQLAASDYSGIPAYANNAAAVAVLGAGKLYYTDVAGEYILKITH